MLVFILAACLDISGHHELVCSDGYYYEIRHHVAIVRDLRSPTVFHATLYEETGRAYMTFSLRYASNGSFIQSTGEGLEKTWRFSRNSQRVLLLHDHIWRIVLARTPSR